MNKSELESQVQSALESLKKRLDQKFPERKSYQQLVSELYRILDGEFIYEIGEEID